MDSDSDMQAFGSYGTRGLLLGSGLLAAAIAMMILFAPVAFYSAYGIDMVGNASLASELKAPAGTLLMAGIVIMAGAFRSRLTAWSLAIAAAVYLSYGASRLVSIAIDGVPQPGLVTAAIIELVIGALCGLDLLRLRQVLAGHRARTMTAACPVGAGEAA